MNRASKFSSVFFFLILVLTSISQTQAQSTYELGPYLAIGAGETATEARTNAYIEAWDIIDSMAAILPAGHDVIDFVVDSGELIGDTYFLEFFVIVEYDSSGRRGNGGGGEEQGETTPGTSLVQ